MSRCFLDSNVLIEAIGRPESAQGGRSGALVARVLAGEETVVLEPNVVLETTSVLTRRLGISIPTVSDYLVLFVSAQTVKCDSKDQVLEALQRWRDQPALSFPDWFHLIVTRDGNMTGIYTFDRAMDRLPGVMRIEP